MAITTMPAPDTVIHWHVYFGARMLIERTPRRVRQLRAARRKLGEEVTARECTSGSCVFTDDELRHLSARFGRASVQAQRFLRDHLWDADSDSRAGLAADMRDLYNCVTYFCWTTDIPVERLIGGAS